MMSLKNISICILVYYICLISHAGALFAGSLGSEADAQMAKKQQEERSLVIKAAAKKAAAAQKAANKKTKALKAKEERSLAIKAAAKKAAAAQATVLKKNAPKRNFTEKPLESKTALSPIPDPPPTQVENEFLPDFRENKDIATPEVSIRPARNILNIEPNTEYKGFFLLNNHSHADAVVKIEGEDWSGFSEGKRKKGMPDWLQFEKRNYDIPVNGTVRIPYTINMPQISGQILAQVFFVPTFKNPAGKALRTRMGALIVAIADGTQKSELSNLRIILDSVKEKAYLQIENTGNVIQTFTAEVVFTSPLGIEGKATLKGSPSIMPEQTKRIDLKLINYSNYKGTLLAEVKLHQGARTPKEHTSTHIVSVE